MIDVVFLLLVFFMLASRFGVEQAIQWPAPSQSAAAYAGPPRLVEIAPDSLSLNGREVGEAELAAALSPLTASASDTIVLRAREGATVQRVVDVMEILSGQGFSSLVLVE